VVNQRPLVDHSQSVKYNDHFITLIYLLFA